MTFALLLLLLLTTACGPDDPGPNARVQAKSKPGKPPRLVKTVALNSGGFVDRWRYLGTVRAQTSARVTPRLPGRIDAIEVRAGDRVEAGQPLVKLDPELARAQLEAARATVERGQTEQLQSQRESQRAERLPLHMVPTEERERKAAQAEVMRARLRNSRAQAQRAKLLLDEHILRAPFSGVVRARLAEPGEWVAAGTPVLELLAGEQIEVIADVEPTALPHLQASTAIILRSGEHRLPAELITWVPALDPETRTSRIRLRPTAQPDWLLPGLALWVEVTVERRDGISVPRDALVIGVRETRVFRVVEGRSEAVPVEILGSHGEQALVSATKLHPGDRVIVRGNERMRPGQPVKEAP